MKTIVIATGYSPLMNPLNERIPTPLMPLMDRPWIQHLIELFVGQGIGSFTFILSHLPEKIEEFLGDGTRWGSKFSFSLAKDPLQPYRHLPVILTDDPNEPLFLAHADCIPQIEIGKCDLSAIKKPYLFFGHNDKNESVWTGWGILSAQQLSQLAEQDSDAFQKNIVELAVAQGSIVDVPLCLHLRSFRDLLTSNRQVLHNQFEGLLLTGKSIEPGIWISRNVILHPTVKIVPPVYIGSDCQIQQSVVLGPDVVIGNNCVLEKQSLIKNALIFSHSYIGEGLEIEECLVEKNCLVNLQLDTVIQVQDNFILGHLSQNLFGEWIRGALSRLTALLLFLLFLPLSLCTMLILKIYRKGPVVHRTEVTRLPCQNDLDTMRSFQLKSFASYDAEKIPRSGWKHFFLFFLPALVHIVRGEIRFVGVPPRSQENIRQLSEDWRALYLKSKAGIVTEAYLRYDGSISEDESYAADAFYAVSSGIVYDTKLLLQYLAKILKG